MLVFQRATPIPLYCLAVLGSLYADVDGPVNITANLPYVDVMHKGKKVRIERIQEPGNLIEPDFAQTSRPCPPYCIQPIQLAPGVETIGEQEMLQYLKTMGKTESIIVIDSRESKWLSKGMIPGAVHLPWTKLHNKTSNEDTIADILQLQFNADFIEKLWHFQNARTLVFYCNGPWCGQSPTNIRALLSIGYPAHKLKWYRGGMQSWKLFGLTTVPP